MHACALVKEHVVKAFCQFARRRVEAPLLRARFSSFFFFIPSGV
jgi:hypothetical protein